MEEQNGLALICEELWVTHLRVIKPNGIKSKSMEDRAFVALGAAGEVGEVANLVKKQWRGDTINEDRIQEEIGDSLAYLTLLAKCYGWTLEDCLTSIMDKVRGRWPERLELKPLGCDCYPGCWGDHSVGWFVVAVPESRRTTASSYCVSNFQYGTWVMIDDTIRLIDKGKADELEARLMEQC